jgi:MYXO-CTERM domain-containing protein
MNLRFSTISSFAAAALSILETSQASAAVLTNTVFTAMNPDEANQVSGSVASATSAGGAFTWNVTTGTNLFMQAVTNFASRMTEVGDKTVVKFDFTLAQNVATDQGADFRFTLFDSIAGTAGAEMIQLVVLGNQTGANSGMMRARFDNNVTGATNALNNGGGTIGGNAYAPGSNGTGVGLPIWQAGDVHTFTTTVERLTSTVLSYTVLWENSAGSATMSIPSYNEVTGAGAFDATDAWAGGKVNQFNGFALTIFQADPFSDDGLPGSGTISNFSVTGVPEPSAAVLGVLALGGCLARRRR